MDIKKFSVKQIVFSLIILLLLIIGGIFYFVNKNTGRQQERTQIKKNQQANLSGDPADIFLNLRKRRATTNYFTIYQSQTEEATSTATSSIKTFTVSVKQSGAKQKVETSLKTAKLASLIKNQDGLFACNYVESYNNPPCYKFIADKDASAVDLQKLGLPLEKNLRAYADKGFLAMTVAEKKVQINGIERLCADFQYSLKADALNPADIREFFPMIADVSDDDINAAKKMFAQMRNQSRLCLDLDTGIPLEMELSMSAGAIRQITSQYATTLLINPNFNERLTFDTLQSYDDALAKYAFGKIISYNGSVYAAARGILEMRNNKIISQKNEFGAVKDFAIYGNRLYTAAGEGIFRLIKNNEWEKMKLDEKTYTFGKGFDSFYEASGQLYAAGEFTGVFRLENDLWVEAGKFPKSVSVNALYGYKNDLYARTTLDGIYRLNNGQWELFLGPEEFGGTKTAQLKTYRGNLYALASSDIYHINNGKPIIISSYKEHGIINLIYEHNDGLYIGSNKGLFLIKNGAPAELLAGEKEVGEINAIISFNNNLYIGGEQGAFIKTENGWQKFSWFNDFGPVNNFYIINNTLYAAGGLGAAKLAGNEWIATPINYDEDKFNPNVEAMHSCNDDIYFISVNPHGSAMNVLHSITDANYDEFSLPPEAKIIEIKIEK